MPKFFTLLFLFASVLVCEDEKKDKPPEVAGTADTGENDVETEVVVNFPPPDGFPPVERDPAFLRFDNIEHFALNSLQDLSVDAAERRNSRFLILTDKWNEGASTEAMAVYRQAVNKALNSISGERDIALAKGVDSTNTILRIDLRDYDLTSTKWSTIQSAEPFNIVSKTQRGELIQLLTGAEQTMMHANNFIETAMLGQTYYAILGIPKDLNSFYGSVEVDLDQQFQDLDQSLLLVGISNSEIALQKTRLFLRTESRFGPFWSTYDTVIGNNQNSVVFEDPFPAEANSNRIFNHDAQEFIWELENGCHGYALFNAFGQREDFAPTNIVFDTSSGGLSPQIDAARSCTKCHASGFILAEDQVFNKVRLDPSFTGADRELARRLFGRTADTAAAFTEDNNRYSKKCLEPLGIEAFEPDPINQFLNTFRQEWNIKQVASFLFLPEGEFSILLRGSRAFAQIGQLVDGESINSSDLIKVLPILQEDLNLFADPLGR